MDYKTLTNIEINKQYQLLNNKYYIKKHPDNDITINFGHGNYIPRNYTHFMEYADNYVKHYIIHVNKQKLDKEKKQLESKNKALEILYDWSEYPELLELLDRYTITKKYNKLYNHERCSDLVDNINTYSKKNQEILIRR